MVTEDSALVARVKDFGGLENGFIVLSTTDVVEGGTLNPDAAGNQKFAVAAQNVSGTVNASTLGTYRAYLVDGTTVKQRCGQVTIAEPSQDPTLTSLTVGGTAILTTGSSKTIDENSALAGSIINRSELTNGFVVLSATNVAVGGTLNPDAAGNQKFAVSADSISGTVNASTPATLHAYLVDGTSVLQKCGDVVIVAPTATVVSLIADGTDIVGQAASKQTTNGNLAGTYDAKHMELLTNPRIVLSTSLNVAVGSQVTGQYGFVAANGNAQAFNLSGIADGDYRVYLIAASSAGSNTGTVAQVMGQVIAAEVVALIRSVKLDNTDLNQNRQYNQCSYVKGTFSAGANGKTFSCVVSDGKPAVGTTLAAVGSITIADGAAQIAGSTYEQDKHYYPVVGTLSGGNITIEESWDYWFNTGFNPN